LQAEVLTGAESVPEDGFLSRTSCYYDGAIPQHYAGLTIGWLWKTGMRGRLEDPLIMSIEAHLRIAIP